MVSDRGGNEHSEWGTKVKLKLMGNTGGKR